jgi:ribosomal protein S18 acetylase RimI-like enzyme
MRSPDAARLERDARHLFDRPLDRPALRAYLSDPRNLLLLASIGSDAVGFLRATGLRQLHTRRLQMFLYEIGVTPRHRARGVGRALVKRLLKHCRDRGFEEVFVLTDPRNRAAVGLYRSTGAVTETRGDRMFVYRLRNGR